MRVENGEPARFGSGTQVVHQSLCALQPASADGLLSSEKMVPTERGGDPRGSASITRCPVALERSKARVERRCDVVQPPGRRAESLERLGALDPVKGCHEGSPCVCPGAAGEGVVAGSQVDRC